MKIAFLGVGGVGGYFGGKLARAGVDTTFVARGEQLAALRENGLRVETAGETFSVNPVAVVSSIADAGPQDVIFVTTKTYDRDVIAAELGACVSESTMIIPLQNGVDNDLRIKDLAPWLTVYPGLTYIISARTAPGVISHTGGATTISFGDRSGKENSRLLALEAVLRKADIKATYSRDIERDIWSKFTWLTTFAGMTSLCRAPLGSVVGDPEGYKLFFKCFEEALAVAASCGVDLGDEARAVAVARAVEYRDKNPGVKASMLIDIENGRRTEIDSLNGALVRLARERKISAPINELICVSVRLASAEYLKS